MAKIRRKVREHAWIERLTDGSYRMRTNEGTYTDSTYDLQSLQKQVDYINNEDADNPHYFYVYEELPFDEEEHAKRMEYEKEKERIQRERAEERKRKEQERIENNRKSKRSNDTYVYVIACIERGYTTTEYWKGGTNLLKMDGFATTKVKDAKTFKTKASAQKMVDALSKVFLVRKVYRNFKVVQKKKELFQ